MLYISLPPPPPLLLLPALCSHRAPSVCFILMIQAPLPALIDKLLSGCPVGPYPEVAAAAARKARLISRICHAIVVLNLEQKKLIKQTRLISIM